MGAAMVGVILFQVPTGWLADRLGKRPVLLLCYAVVLAGLVVVPCCSPGPWLGLWLFLVGGCSAALFPVGLAILGQGHTGGGQGKANVELVTAVDRPAVLRRFLAPLLARAAPERQRKRA